MGTAVLDSVADAGDSRSKSEVASKARVAKVEAKSEVASKAPTLASTRYLETLRERSSSIVLGDDETDDSTTKRATVENTEVEVSETSEIEVESPAPASWAPRCVLGGLVRVLAMAIPVTASAATGIALASVLPEPSGAVGTVLWYGTIFVASMVALFAVDRFARRLLPLSVLLRISLIFPDEAPSRLGVALRAGSKRTLAHRIEKVRADGGDPLGPEEVAMLGAALNAHDRRTRGHSERVRALTELVADEMGLPAEDADRLRWGAFLHDIGKLAVPAPVLNKAGKLDAREWHVVQRHPVEGEQFAESLEEWLGDWLHAIGQHHERFDGTGYPDGLAGDEISLAGRIVAVTDAYETMTAVRTYSRPKTPVEARRELSACAGTHFDPVVVRGFMNISIGKLRWTAGLAAWLAQIPFLGVPTRAGAQMATSAAAAQGSAGAVAGSVLMSVAGIATPIAMGSGVAAAAIVAPPAVSSDAPGDVPAADVSGDVVSDPTSSTVSGDGAKVSSTDAENEIETETDGSPGRGRGANSGSGNANSGSGSGSGKSGSAPGQTGSTPGQSGSTPGQSGAQPPGQSGSTPGQSGSTPGQSGSNSGNGGNGGNSGDDS